MQSELFMNVEASFQNQADQNLPETFSQVAPTGHHKHKDPKNFWPTSSKVLVSPARVSPQRRIKPLRWSLCAFLAQLCSSKTIRQ
jgi:hypothetical protein